MLSPRQLRADPADPTWPDRDRIFRAADATETWPGEAEDVLGAPGLVTAAAVGAALAERMLAARFGRSLVDHRTWLFAGAAELAAGATHEAAAIAGAMPLNRLTVIAHLPHSESLALNRFAAMGWAVRRVELSDRGAFDAAVSAAQRAQKPTLIACFGARPETPPDLEKRNRGPGARLAWLKRLRRHASAEAFQRAESGRPPQVWLEAVATAADQPTVSPAAAAMAALGRLAAAWPELAGFAPDPAFAGAAARSVAWGGRATAIAGGLFGMALHGGLVPVAHIAASAAELALPAFRAAALAGLRTIHLIEETASLPASLFAAWRALPTARFFRPATGAEAVECLEAALRYQHGPSILLLARSSAAAPRRGMAGRGGYLLEAPADRDVTLIAGGADLALATAAHDMLAAAGIRAALVSLPCRQVFALQAAEYRAQALGDAPRVGLEAGCPFGWAALLGPDGLFIDSATTSDAAGVAATISRYLRRGRRVLDNTAEFLESGGGAA
ncbi:MAG TPA: hypothetical protein VMB71_01205 [Acetobacteraceae bacterium]|nr:hypothetical protein [Acetobacteraceae bacterium]